MLHHPIDQAGNMPGFAQRSDCMMLDNIRKSDVLRGQVWHFKDDAQALRTTDIQGSAPTYAHKKFHVDGPAYKEHIPGTAAKTHYPELRRPVDLSLTTVDIDKSWPEVVKFKTPRVVDPIAPSYDLPSARHRPHTPLKQRIHEGQVRDSMEHVGTSKKRIPDRNYSRNPNESRDVPFSQPNFRRSARPLGSTGIRDVMQTDDVTGERNLTMMRKTPRCSNPLDPTYVVSTRTTHPIYQSEAPSAHAPREQGAIHGAAPKALTYDNGEPQTSLLKEDIQGTSSQRYKGCVPFNIYDPPEVTPYSQFHGCEDIEGAKAGTRKGGPAR